MNIRSASLALAALLVAVAIPAGAQTPALTKLTFATNWYAEAEHGGFYQAVAEGTYKKYGLDVTVKMGGPQVNGLQLLVANQIDLFMGYDIQSLKVLEQNLPVVTVGTTFQKYDPADRSVQQEATAQRRQTVSVLFLPAPRIDC